MSDENQVQDYLDNRDEPKDDVEGHRFLEKEEVVEEADVEGHMFDEAHQFEQLEQIEVVE